MTLSGPDMVPTPPAGAKRSSLSPAAKVTSAPSVRLVTTVEPVAPCGNPAKAKRLLGWQNTVPFGEMIVRLVKSEYDKL